MIPEQPSAESATTTRDARAFLRTGAVWLLIIVSVTGYLAQHDNGSTRSLTVGNAAIFLALVFSVALCSHAAGSRRGAQDGQGLRLAWGFMALSFLLAASGQVMYTVKSQTGGGAPSPVLDMLLYVGWSIPIVAALLAFPKPPELLISRYRSTVDAVVITTGLIFISGATVLSQVWQAADLRTAAGWSGLAYPTADLTICAVVFTLGMRQYPVNRWTWFCLGSGLVTLAVTDSIYVRLLADGQTGLTGTPLVAGWMAAPVLTALATLVPRRVHKTRVRDLTLAAQLVPYLPVWVAVVVLGLVSVRGDPFLLVVGALLLAAVTVRQIMIVYENVSLTRDLEKKVAARTAELATLGSIVTSSADAIVGVSLDGVITAWNPAAEQLYGYPAERVVGRAPDFLPREVTEVGQKLVEEAGQARELTSYELSWHRPDGSSVPVALRVSPVRDGAVVRGISIFGQDITERKRAAAALELAREEALESSKLKSEFLATMSHEIRTPMNGVIGLTGLLLDTTLDDDQRRYAEGVGGAGQALLSVINDILDFSKLEAGKVMLDPTPFNPRQLVEDVGALLAPAAHAKGLELVAFCLPWVPEEVVGDSGKMRQILLNLTQNAVKFTSSGEVAVAVTSAVMTDGRVQLRFEVSDTGMGIADRDRERLFESFSQADATTTRRFGGSGLGLAICRRLVDVMAGRIGVESQLGAGSTFWFEVTVPLGALEPVAARPGPRHLLEQLRVLVVDDNATARHTLQSQLASWQMLADVAEDASTALESLGRMAVSGQPYHLALLDLQMPDEDGLQLARTISIDPRFEGTALVLLTSTTQPESERLQETRVRALVSKPLRMTDLADTLVRLVAAPAPSVDPVRLTQSQPPENLPPLERILVVEDNKINRLVAQGMLAKLGYQVDSVENGLEAVSAVENTPYAAVLMDCHMPVMDGITATQEIRRRHHSGHRIPIIAMTAGALTEDRDRCLDAGMNDYMSKPVSLTVLRETLERWVNGSAPEDRDVLVANTEP